MELLQRLIEDYRYHVEMADKQFDDNPDSALNAYKLALSKLKDAKNIPQYCKEIEYMCATNDGFNIWCSQTCNYIDLKIDEIKRKIVFLEKNGNLLDSFIQQGGGGIKSRIGLGKLF